MTYTPRVRNKLTDNQLLDFLRVTFEYDESKKVGKFTRKIDTRHYKKGTIAGNVNKYNGLWRININSRDHYEHNLVWLWHNGQLPWRKLLRYNKDRLDNRLENLYIPKVALRLSNLSFDEKVLKDKGARVRSNARKYNHSLRRLPNGLYRAHLGDYYKDFENRDIAKGWHLKSLGELGFNYVL